MLSNRMLVALLRSPNLSSKVLALTSVIFFKNNRQRALSLHIQVILSASTSTWTQYAASSFSKFYFYLLRFSLPLFL